VIDPPKVLAAVARTHGLVRWSGAVAMLVGGLVLLARVFELPLLSSFVSEWLTMKANTALGFVLCGAAMWLLQRPGRPAGIIARVCTILLGGIAIHKLLEIATGWNLGTRQFLLRAQIPGTSSSGMASSSAFCFALMAGALWLMNRPPGKSRRPWILEGIGSYVVLIALIALLGHLGHFKVSYRWMDFTGMSLLSASLLVLLGAGVFVFAWREIGARWLIQPWVSVGFAAGLALLVAVASYSHRSTTELVRASEWVAHSEEVLSKISELRSSVDEQQSAMGGYVITGNVSFIPRSRNAGNHALIQVQELRQLTSDNADQQRRVAALEKRIGDRMPFVAQAIELRTSSGFDAAAAWLGTGNGMAILDAIREQLRELEEEERQLLQARTADSKTLTGRTLSMLPVGTVLSLVFLGLGLFRLNREMVTRQRGAEALQLSGRRLRMALMGAEIGEWELNLVTHAARRSLKHDQIFGYVGMLPEWTYELFLSHVHPQDRTRVDGEFQESMATGGDWDFECRIIRHDGTPGWIWARGAAVKDDAGELVEMLGMVRDITSRKQAEEELSKSQQLLTMAIEGGRFGIWTWDLVADHLVWNERCKTMVGLPADTEMNLALALATMHPEDRDRINDLITRALEIRETVHFDYRVVRPDGVVRWMHTRGRTFEDATGKPITFTGTMLDVTESKQAEEEIRRLNAELEQRVAERTRELLDTNASLTASEERYRTLFEYAPDGIVIADSKSFYLDANPSICRMLGYRRGELIGLHATDIVAESESKHIGPALSAIKSTSPYHREWQFRRKDGGFFDAEVIATQMPDGNLLAMIRDITERKRAETALKLNEFSVQQASVATFWIAPDARILRVNQAAGDLLGYTEAELLALAIPDLDPDFTSERWPAHWQELRELKRMRFETRQRHKDGHIIPVEVDLNWFEFEGQEYNFAFIRDVTASKMAEAERQKFVSLVANSAEFIGMCDLQGMPFFLNEAALRLVGLDDPAQALRTPVTEFFFPEDQAFIRDEFLPRVQREGRAEVEIRFRHFRTGAAIQMIYNVFVVLDALGQPVAFATVSRDITERMRREVALATAHAALEAEITERRRLEEEILGVGEREQARIGQDLHDDLGQQLVGISMLMQLISSQLAAESHPRAAEAARLKSFLSECILTTRNLAKSLYPVELERGGLILALEELANRTEMLAGVSCKVNSDDGFKFGIATEIHLYRIVQESISNSVKHGKARNIVIDCSVRDGISNLTVIDDGSGFEQPEVGKRAGIGLHLFQYRARLIGARLTVTRGENGGCQVRCSLGESDSPGKQSLQT
jgi:PAS domain S-box-containing protein